ncbi:MAG: hypothetical protein K2N66_03010, partial [Paramuribaculum sp.]|nr:hypothetical protein [Paramuribaculum sp.]
RRDFTARYLPQAPYLVMGLMSSMWWVWLVASAAAVIAALPSLVTACAVVVVALALCIPVMVWWRRTAKVLNAPAAACVTAPLL